MTNASGQSRFARGAQLAALSTLALGQPLLDLLARHPAFLIAHRASPATVLTIAAGLLVVPPLVLWIAEIAADRLSRAFGSALRTALTGTLAAAVVLPIAGNTAGLSGLVAVCVSVGCGALVAVGSIRWRWLRQFLTVLGVAPLVASVAFVSNEQIAKLLRPQPKREAVALNATINVPTTELPTILFVIFDELPLTSLLDDHERIDPVRFPAFARLAATSTWFRGASSVHAESILAVPSILTGRFPDENRLPTAADHPDNLFSLLGARYRIVADEPVTTLFEPPGVRATSPLTAVAADLWTIYLHFLLPAEFTSGLPSLAQTWKGFGDTPDPEDAAGDAHTDRVPRLIEFTASIDASARDEPTLYFLHTLFPHPPWEHLPSGRKYFPANAGIPHHRWGPIRWWAEQGYQQHLLQLVYTDACLWRMLERLDRADLFDSALIVVTADHGATFWPNSDRRGLRDHPEDVMSVPLLIKAPHQREPQTIDRLVESVDILPSVADLLGIEMPWDVDGCSPFDERCARREQRSMEGRPFPADTVLRRESLAMKLELFGSGAADGSGLDGLFRIGPRTELLGREVGAFDVHEDPSLARVMQGGFALAAHRPEQYAAARITGLVVGDLAQQPVAQIAVATRGVIRAVVPALPFKNQGLLFSALLPERFATTNPAQLQIFSVSGEGPITQLHRLQVRYEAFRPH